MGGTFEESAMTVTFDVFMAGPFVMAVTRTDGHGENPLCVRLLRATQSALSCTYKKIHIKAAAVDSHRFV